MNPKSALPVLLTVYYGVAPEEGDPVFICEKHHLSAQKRPGEPVLQVFWFNFLLLNINSRAYNQSRYGTCCL